MLAWKIAVRYLFSKKSHGVVNVISVISVIGVAVATMAITIVLSVFNGFTDLASSHLSKLDPEIRINAMSGKTIMSGDSLASALQSLPYVQMAVPVVEERGLVIFSNMQMPVIFKGVPEDYNRFAMMDSIMIDGEYATSVQGMSTAQISAGVAVKTGARPGANNVLSLYVPRRTGRINPANPAAAFSQADMVVSGVFQIGQSEYDSDHIFLNIGQARDLLQYDTEATSVEVKLAPGIDIEKGAKMLQKQVGKGYKILTRMQQQEEAFRMIQIEKWVTFLMLAFILVIASFNIISTLSLLVIEKRDNMRTLRAIGAPKYMISNIFIIQGWLISVCGGIVGIICGTLLCLAQQEFGLVKLAGDTEHMIVSTYPVQLQWPDLLVVFILVVVIGLLTSQVTRLFTKFKDGESNTLNN